MNNKFRTILLICLMLGTLVFVCGCSGAKDPYQINDEEDFSVSVRFDANGGTFTTNVTVMTDSFNVSKLPTNEAGEAQVPLLAPDDPQRGNGNAFSPVKNGHFLLGWYAQREDAPDGEGSVYSEKWDFEKDRLTVDPNGDYSASEPVMTLYAVWAPLFEIEFYDLGTDDLLDTYTYDPTLVEVAVPSWDTEEGTIEMERFPKKIDHTFHAAYYDKEGTRPVDTDTVEHSAVIDETTGTVTGHSMKLYVEWLEGEWYHIYSAEQFVDNASLRGNYVIHEDLDFSDEIWPNSLMYGNFSGSIQGNGHTFSNITAEQTNNSKNYAGLFGNITESAQISDITFQNVTFTIRKGTRVVGTNFGLFAGHISDAANIVDVQITDSTLQIDSGIYYTDDSEYIIGLVCAMGDMTVIDHSGISCVAVGDAPEKVIIMVTDGMVDLEIVSE